MAIREFIRKAIEQAVLELYPNAGPAEFSVDRAEDARHGDYATNAALILGKRAGRKPLDVADELASHLEHPDWRVETAAPGFLNFFLSENVYKSALGDILEHPEDFGKNDTLKGKKIIVEYTDPNPFKEFHIGHLMSNAIGESLSRIIEFSGSEVKRANYQGDVGMHVARAVWAVKNKIDPKAWEEIGQKDNAYKAKILGEMYATGSKAAEDETIKNEIKEINKKIFEKSDPGVNKIYEEGKKWSLEYFEDIYKKLGTRFDFYFFESETSGRGQKLVEEGLKKNIFEKSDGAVVYQGEKKGLHTRVFINSEGLPTYEAKELGLAVMKYERYPYDAAFVVTGNEIVEYFKVVKAALSELYPDLAASIRHIPHGMLRLRTGKMSSRTGEVIRAEGLIEEVRERIAKTISGDITARAAQGILHDPASIEPIAVGAVKYSILKQSAGRDIVFDFETSLSFEGDSGPYIQYTYARTRSLLEKGKAAGIVPSIESPVAVTRGIERILLGFPEAAARAEEECDPHHIATYLFALAQEFNNFYGRERIIGSEDAAYKLAVTQAASTAIKNGLWLLGIEAPEKM